MSKRKNQINAAALAIFVALFAWGIFELLVMRFDTGTMFPPYSSYRNDPLGTKALYASLDSLPEINATRYVNPLEKLTDAPAAQTVLLIGINTQQPNEAPSSFVKEIDAVAEKGGRIVLAFAPTEADFVMEESQKRRARRLTSANEPDEKESDQTPTPQVEMVSLMDYWGIGLDFEPLRFDGDGGIIAPDASAVSNSALPEIIAWHNGLHFDLVDDAWRPIYESRDEVVIAERDLGLGTLVFLGDSYYLTNESLAADRQSELLAWLIGDKSNVQFGEQHLGMQRNPGAAALMRRYGLESLIAGFLGLALLFAWRASASLAPRYSDTLPTNVGDMELGRDAHAGFSNLVRRSTPRGEVVEVCVNQWRQSVLPGLGRADANELSKALGETVQANKAAAPADAYRAVLNQLQERNVRTAYDRKS